jgi:hypothetical protein
MMPGNNRVGAGQVAANVLMAETPHVDLCGSGLPSRLRWYHDRCTPDSRRLDATPKSEESGH